MLFEVKPKDFSCPNTPKDQVYLIEDLWNDWFDYKTLYTLVYVDNKGIKHKIGGVKIGEFNMKPHSDHYVKPDIPNSFEELSEGFFSLGQDVTYYSKLNKLGEDVRYKILKRLKDVALDEELFEKALFEDVMSRSLLRGVSRSSVRGQYRRLANGDASLTEYKFKYTAPKNKKNNRTPIELTFEVTPKSSPPTNIHILIGRNGVGKTHLLNNMINSLVRSDDSKQIFGSFSSDLDEDIQEVFANLVSVSFSAFEQPDPIPEKRTNSTGMIYSYVGLQQPIKEERTLEEAGDIEKEQRITKSPEMLSQEFYDSLSVIKMGAKVSRWTRAIKMLNTDPIFKEVEATKLAYTSEKEVKKTFSRLSSGHKIVLLTITKLVEKVEERSLVILDEPEGHLHPPLLSAFTRALSDLLIHRNGVAIIATHSPVILQEVPKSCAYILNRSGSIVNVERPELETFGENVGILTREVFGLEVTHSGFHTLIQEAIESEDDFDSILDSFNHELGMEARAIIRALLANRSERNPE